MSTTRRYTSADLELLPDIEGVRYEIIDGELFVAKQPRWEHQYACNEVGAERRNWSHQTGLGLTLVAPGLVFAEVDDVAPDVVWISHERLAALEDAAGHLAGAPELVVEVLSPGASNARRDREAKLGLYSRRGVDEYWIVDWRTRTVDLFRRGGDRLDLVATLTSGDTINSPFLPGFACSVSTLWPPSRP